MASAITTAIMTSNGNVIHNGNVIAMAVSSNSSNVIASNLDGNVLAVSSNNGGKQ
jgi:hypothetical protein